MKSINDIIKGLKVCTDEREKCDECPYDEFGNWCSENMKIDAAEALEGFLVQEDDLK